MYTLKEKGKNYKSLWVIEVWKEGNDVFPISIKEFTRKAVMQNWLKTQTEYK